MGAGWLRQESAGAPPRAGLLAPPRQRRGSRARRTEHDDVDTIARGDILQVRKKRLSAALMFASC